MGGVKVKLYAYLRSVLDGTEKECTVGPKAGLGVKRKVCKENSALDGNQTRIVKARNESL